jgi:hypothetical protein
MFIVTVLSVAPTLAGNWQLIRYVIRRVRRPNRPAPSALVAVPEDEAIARAPAPTPPCLPPAPRWIMRPGYQYTGGAVSTGAVVDLDGYMESVMSQPVTNTSWLGAVRSATAGTTATA